MALVVKLVALKNEMYLLGETEGYSTNEDVPGVNELLEQTFGLLNIRDISALTGLVSRLLIVAMFGTLLESVQAYFLSVVRMLLVICGLRFKRNTSNLYSFVTRVSYLGTVVKTNIHHECDTFGFFRMATKPEGFQGVVSPCSVTVQVE